ncbi:glutaredoxin family protein [Nocardia sp. IFM 10818]
MNRKHVRVYTLPDCQPCKLTKAWLDREGIEYTEIAADHPAAADYLKFRLGAQSAPVVEVLDREDHWIGFRPEKLKELKAAWR